MGVLGKLPNLRSLHLCNSYTGSKMVCSASCFHKLEFLTLESFYELEEWEIEEGTMPCLKKLYLKFANMIPEGLKFVTTLQELQLTNGRREFVNRVKVVNGVEVEEFHRCATYPPSQPIDDLFQS